MTTPSVEAQLRLKAAADLLTAAAEGRAFSVIEAIEGARGLLDRALDAEIGALEASPTEGSGS